MQRLWLNLVCTLMQQLEICYWWKWCIVRSIAWTLGENPSGVQHVVGSCSSRGIGVLELETKTNGATEAAESWGQTIILNLVFKMLSWRFAKSNFKVYSFHEVNWANRFWKKYFPKHNNIHRSAYIHRFKYCVLHSVGA